MSEEGKKSQLDDIQLQLIDRISKNDTNGFKQLLGQLKGGVNFVDDSGMSILAHASFKGNKEAVQLLLDMVSLVLLLLLIPTKCISRFASRVPTSI